MNKLKPGDMVQVHTKSNQIVSPYDTSFEEKKTLQVIGSDQYGYYLHIPGYIILNNSYTLEPKEAKEYSIDSKFIGELVLYIREGFIAKVINKMDGCVCKKCKEFYHQSQPNQPDGSMICWLCRNYPYR
jgi:hypothetical protein